MAGNGISGYGDEGESAALIDNFIEEVRFGSGWVEVKELGWRWGEGSFLGGLGAIRI